MDKDATNKMTDMEKKYKDDQENIMFQASSSQLFKDIPQIDSQSNASRVSKVSKATKRMSLKNMSALIMTP